MAALSSMLSPELGSDTSSELARRRFGERSAPGYNSTVCSAPGEDPRAEVLAASDVKGEDDLGNDIGEAATRAYADLPSTARAARRRFRFEFARTSTLCSTSTSVLSAVGSKVVAMLRNREP